MPTGFYVTIIRGKRIGYLVGPFLMKADADSHVDCARRMAIEIDPWAHFDTFGVTKITRNIERPLPLGVLNAQIDVSRTMLA